MPRFESTTASNADSCLLWLAVTFSIHNLEEVVWDLPARVASHLNRPVGVSEFYIAVVGATGIAWALYFAYRKRPGSRLCQWSAALGSAALLANSLSHVALSLLHVSPMPGLLSAAVFMGPISAVCVFKFSRLLALNLGKLVLLVTGGIAIQLVFISLLTALAQLITGT